MSLVDQIAAVLIERRQVAAQELFHSLGVSAQEYAIAVGQLQRQEKVYYHHSKTLVWVGGDPV